MGGGGSGTVIGGAGPDMSGTNYNTNTYYVNSNMEQFLVVMLVVSII